MKRLTHRRETRSGVFSAGSGVTLRYTRYGSGPEALVVIPGIDDAVQNLHALPWFWAWYFRPLVERGHRVYVISRARGLATPLKIADLADLYADVIERHIGPAHLLGISMGGMIAQHIAAKHPKLVKRLILAVTAHRLAEAGHQRGEQLMALASAGRWLAFMRLTNELCFSGSLRWLVALGLWLASPVGWILERRARRSARVRAGRDFCTSANACAEHDGESILPHIEAPTLVWGARADPLFPPAALERMTGLMPNARRVTVDGAHAAFLQKRSSFQRSVVDFLARAPTDIEFCIVGSGFAGLGMAIRLKKRGRDSFLILEQDEAVGGTWRENQYPGCACDIPSPLYSYSFEPNPRWTRLFAPRGEIQAYLERCVQRHGLSGHLRLRTALTRADYDPRGFWRVVTADGASFTCRYLVLGVGGLSRPAYPKLPGIERFRGTVIHSAEWHPNLDLAGKRVAVIGTGASAIQLVPQLAEWVAELRVFQRTPPWVLPKPDRPISHREHVLFELMPWLQRLYRWWIYWVFELRCLGFTIDPRLMRFVARIGRAHIRRQIDDSALRRAVTPDYMPGCKRILMANDYYPALCRENVSVVTEPIVQATESGLTTRDGVEHELDAIVYGTGFRVGELLTSVSIVGLGGRDLNTAWKTGSEAYLGTLIAGFPNLFMLLGPNTGLGHNSMVFMIESQIELVFRCLEALERREARAVQVRRRAQRAFNRALQPRLHRSVWASGCQSWYLDDQGRNRTLWPGFTFEFWLRARRLSASVLEFDAKPGERAALPASTERAVLDTAVDAGDRI